MEITQKQAEFIDATKTGIYNEFVLAGGTGSAKTFGILHYLDVLCEVLPGARIGMFRHSYKTIKTNLIPSLKKVCRIKNKNISIVGSKAIYPNGSQIIFGWADITKDPDADNVKGGEYTALYFNEANQISPKYINTARTRIGRWNNFEINSLQYNLKPMLFLDFNPTNNWVKTEYYDKYQNGTLPPNVFFQLSLPSDNPFLSEDYLEMLETLPEAEYKRYVLGDWNYSDNPSQIVKYEWLKANEIEPKYEADTIGVDVAYTGKDKTILALVKGNSLNYLKELNVDISNTSLQALKIKNISEELGVSRTEIKVDATGVGAGVFDSLKILNLMPKKFIASSQPSEKYQTIELEGELHEVKSSLQFGNKRAEAYWNFRELLRQGLIKVLYDKELWEELTNIEYFEKNGKIYIQSKQAIKKNINRSPDKADAAVIAFSKLEVSKQNKRIRVNKKSSNINTTPSQKIYINRNHKNESNTENKQLIIGAD